ncbi:MAG: phosphoribosylaminoimidazolesuccinocarboxamide synthase [bacterium]
MDAIRETEFDGLTLASRGKVRDIYDLGDELIIVASDRLSAFDVVLPDPIPRKGEVLNRVSAFWFEKMEQIVPNHMISIDVGDYPEAAQPYAEQLEGRSMLVKRADPVMVECVVRGYIAGSGWKEYQEASSVSGVPLSPGLKKADKLPEPIFTPATKAERGLHDENISFERMRSLVGEDLARALREISVEIYLKGSEYAAEKGIIIADTKFEFGLIDGEIILIDEVLTPDSSRFWPRETYEPGQDQESLDKQYVRNYLETLEWDKTPPGPRLPEEVVEETSRKYQEIYQRLTGSPL